VSAARSPKKRKVWRIRATRRPLDYSGAHPVTDQLVRGWGTFTDLEQRLALFVESQPRIGGKPAWLISEDLLLRVLRCTTVTLRRAFVALARSGAIAFVPIIHADLREFLVHVPDAVDDELAQQLTLVVSGSVRALGATTAQRPVDHPPTSALTAKFEEAAA